MEAWRSDPLKPAARSILTPEHVEITLTPAGPGSRYLALLVDSALSLGLTSAIGRLLWPLAPAGIAAGVMVTLGFVITWSYHVYFETRHQGRSPGKRMTGLRVVDGRGLPISPQQSFVRNVIRVLDFAPVFYGLGGITCLMDGQSRRLGDVAADTMVIQEHRPPEYEGRIAPARRFNSLRTPRVTRLIRHRVSIEEREFLLTLCLRADRLVEKKRYDIMEKVAGHYRSKLEIDDPHLSGENLVRDLTAILHQRPGA